MRDLAEIRSEWDEAKAEVDEFFAEVPADVAHNPLLEAWKRFGAGADLIERFTHSSLARHRGIDRFAFAVPNDEALDALAQLGRIVELGAGTGYWARLLALRGCDVAAYDASPPGAHAVEGLEQKGWFKEMDRTWHPVAVGEPHSVRAHPDRALLLCWPDYATPFAAVTLSLYRGSTFAFVGEGPGGCTGDDRFFQELYRDWDKDFEVAIPQWDGIHDQLTVYRRRVEPRRFEEGDDEWYWID